MARRHLRGALFALALALWLPAFMGTAKAATVDLGNVSSATGSMALSGLTFGFPFAVGTDAYSFTLTDNAKVSGQFTVGSTPGIALNIDLMQGATTLVHTRAMLGLYTSGNPPLPIIPGEVSLFSLDLAPGTYQLTFLGFYTTFSGTLAFGPASIATTPIPAALPLFAAALAGLGVIGWRRRKPAAS
jgi:hypothetical protein